MMSLILKLLIIIFYLKRKKKFLKSDENIYIFSKIFLDLVTAISNQF